MQNKKENREICSKGNNDCEYNHLPHVHVNTPDGEYIKYKIQKLRPDELSDKQL